MQKYIVLACLLAFSLIRADLTDLNELRRRAYLPETKEWKTTLQSASVGTANTRTSPGDIASNSYFAFPANSNSVKLDTVNLKDNTVKTTVATFIFKRIAGTKDLYTIRSNEKQSRYLSVVAKCIVVDASQYAFKDQIYGLTEVW